jgi:glycosyltransferase involved in cell wall biosynthesis
MARVLFLDPYHGPSHGALAIALRDHSRHDVTLVALPPRKWKWRMRGAALAFEPLVRALDRGPDLLVSTDMLNLPELLGLMRDALPPRLPVITYFHENQITYPLQSGDERDFHFGLANIYTALASDLVVFNSAFHRDEFLGAVPSLLKQMPDLRPEGVPGRIRRRSEVLGVPLDVPPALLAAAPPPASREPLVLWNHRWEEDKDPETFFRAMSRLDARGIAFKLVVAGQSFRERPSCFERAASDLAHRIEHWGHVSDREGYLSLVARCRVAVSTARHEFFGLAVREAIALGCYPLLPRRVVYPEMVGGRADHLYGSEEEMLRRLEDLLTAPPPAVAPELRQDILSHTPAAVASKWDTWIDDLTGSGPSA